MSGFGFKALTSARRQKRKARLVAYVAIVSDGVEVHNVPVENVRDRERRRLAARGAPEPPLGPLS